MATTYPWANWDIATQFFINLKSGSSNEVNLRLRPGNIPGHKYAPTVTFTVALFDFSGALAQLDFTSDFGGFKDTPPSCFVPSGSQLGSIKFMGNSQIPADYKDYSITVTPTAGASSLNVILGFYIWADSGANDSTTGGFTVDLNGYDWSATGASSTTCLVQISNTSDGNNQNKIDSTTANSAVWLPWNATSA